MSRRRQRGRGGKAKASLERASSWVTVSRPSAFRETICTSVQIAYSGMDQVVAHNGAEKTPVLLSNSFGVAFPHRQ